MTDKTTISKREFLRKTVLTGAGAAGATMLAAPYVKAQAPIKWRLQTYAGPALAEHVVQNSIGWFNKAA
ncbi:MAG TPA: C4-dicarboxylate ABC transporter, partial [Rhizobiaceae bacterium]